MKKILICLFAISITALIPITTTFAANDAGINTGNRGQGVTPSQGGTKCVTGDFLSFPAWNRGLTCEDNHVVIGDEEDAIPKFVWTIVLNILDILFRVAGILAICILIYNGYQYLTSAGDSSKISKAKTGLMQAIVGLAIVILASTIIYFIIGRIQ